MSLESLEACRRASVIEEKLEAWKRVFVNLGSLGTDMRACGSLGSLGTCRAVSVIMRSVKVLSLRALRARAGGDHVPAQSWTSLGTHWDQFDTKLGQIWDTCGTKTGTNVGPIWDHFGKRK